MSVLFPKVNKPREWDYRPIYYDEEKEARKEKLARLHQGALRETYERNRQQRQSQHKSRIFFWLALLGGIVLVYLFLR